AIQESSGLPALRLAALRRVLSFTGAQRGDHLRTRTTLAARALPLAPIVRTLLLRQPALGRVRRSLDLVRATPRLRGQLATSLGNCTRDCTRNQRDRADRVVVARDRVVDDVGIRVRIRDRDDRDAQLVGLLDRDRFLLCVHNEERTGQAAHVLHTAQILLQLLSLTLKQELLLLRVDLVRALPEPAPRPLQPPDRLP